MIFPYACMRELLPFMSEEAKNKAFSAMPALRGVFCFVFPYFTGGEKGNLSLYARGEDYHNVVIKKLGEYVSELKSRYPDNEFIPYADKSPFPEVRAAACAGLGKIGKNGLLLTEKYGSFVFIGVIATDLEGESICEPAFCEGCGACIEACPTGAISENGVCVDRCVSELTQRKGELTPQQREIIKKSPTVWGCDVCQLVCPYNASIEETDIEGFSKEIIRDISLSDLQMSNRAFMKKYGDRAFAWRGITPLRRNLEIKEEK